MRYIIILLFFVSIPSFVYAQRGRVIRPRPRIEMKSHKMDYLFERKYDFEKMKYYKTDYLFEISYDFEKIKKEIEAQHEEYIKELNSRMEEIKIKEESFEKKGWRG